MLHYQSTALSPLQRYKLISGSLIPRPVAWVTTQKTPDSPVNLAPFSYFSTMPSDLPLITLAVGRKSSGQPKDTATNIQTSEEAVVHLVDVSQLKAMNQTSATLSPDQSELSLIQMATEPSQTVTVPSLVDVKARFETTLYQSVPIKNREDRIVTDFFILEITDFYYDESVLDAQTMHINPVALNPVGRLSGPNYTTLGEITHLPRPK